jgi:BirA family transcriptional regulator, biotin operon repressor / biotin---[acetyl-CoA-carboxylase] ligase
VNSSRALTGATDRRASGAALADGHPQLRWPAEAVREALAPLVPGLTVEVLPQVDSTNTELMRRARAGRIDPVLLVGERQTAGRGRLGRGWDSEPGKSLTFSLGLPLAPADWSGLSLAVGVTLAESLDPRIRLKWPNDLWFDDRKLAGILIETGATGSGDRYAVIGVGINLAQRPSTGLATAPAWLGELLPGCASGTVLLRVAPPLVAAVLRFEREGFGAFKGRFEARDALKGRAIVLSDGTSGEGQGITDQGALQVRTERGIAIVSSSEVSVRPRD